MPSDPCPGGPLLFPIIHHSPDPILTIPLLDATRLSSRALQTPHSNCPRTIKMASASVQIPSPALNTSPPTLPPLRSLCLPDIRARRTNLNVPDMDLMSPNSNDLLVRLPLPSLLSPVFRG